MKYAFSAALVRSDSFLDLCETAAEYGYAGFEISDPASEAENHPDSILNPAERVPAKRKLRNRHIEVSAISLAEPVGRGTDPRTITDIIALAADASVQDVIIRIKDGTMQDELRPIFAPILTEAEKSGVTVLIETTGDYSHTKKVTELINLFRTGSVGACWDVRNTYFDAGESAEDTIRNLGAYISYVRLGDRKAGENVLIGEGELPTGEFISALRSLNYEGYLCCEADSAGTDPDIVLTHFDAFIGSIISARGSRREESRFYNRSGTGSFPFEKYGVIEKTFSQVLDTMAEHYPNQYAFKYTTLDYTRSYSEFRDDVDAAAAALIALGVKPGYHVAIWATNIPQWFLTFWAATKIGAVLVTVNTAYKIHEAEYLLAQSDTHTLIMIESCKDSDYRQIMEELCPELAETVPGEPLYSAKLPFLKNVVTVGFRMDGCLDWDGMIKRGAEIPREEVRRRAAAVRPDDVANMQYTSGTTGFPKGVMLTHRNIINNGKIIGDRMDLSTADRMMIQVPMFHCFGMVLSMTSMMTHAGTLCPLPYFSPKSSLACVTAEKITCFNGVPTMFIAMFSHEDFEKTDFSHIRTGIMAGSNCPPELMRRAAAEMNMTEIVSVYGQTESSPGCTMGEVNEDLDHRVETVGSAFPGVECRIVDPETGAELPNGVNGEFVARGFNIMKGYYKMPHATAQTIDAQGWLHTGDICCRTEDGYYRVTGRLKDMIIRGGENIYPREIEEFYLTHEKVKDVQVIGVPDERYGEEACAYIILGKGQETDEAEMREYGESHMARHKVPRYFIFTKEFPMNAAGKILKFKMRDDAVEKLGL